ncbi:MAG: NADH-quinone oxidoreductase subunit J family protein, partial [Chloroflexota bacterium]
MNAVFEWIVFGTLSAIAVAAAAGMLLTMSMYRAGLALMSSFVALAGLFVLLDAQLLAAIQIMMNVGGMLVMILFMVMMMMDPGGQSMWQMKRNMNLRWPGALSMSAPKSKPPAEGGQSGHGEHEQSTHGGHGGMQHQGHGGMGSQGHYQMMASMAMSTAQLPAALILGAIAAVLLILLAVFTPWPVSPVVPNGAAAPAEVGHLLLSRYMIAFEGAAYLILAGIAGAVILGKREGPPAPATGR